MSNIIAITKDTFDVLTETDLDNFIYHSNQNTLKHFVSGVLTVNVSVGIGAVYANTANMTHNLGRYPFYIVYVKHSQATNWEAIGTNYVTAGYGSGNGVFRKFEAWATTTQLFVKARGATDGVTDVYSADFRYKLFRNNLGL